MTRVIFTLVVLLVLTAKLVAEDPLKATSASPKIVQAVASENAGVVRITLIVSHGVWQERVRIVERDGKKVEERYSAVVPVFESTTVEAGHGAIVFDRDGKEIDSKALPTLLKRETPVVLTEDGKLDPFYKQVFRDNILVIALPGSTANGPDPTQALQTFLPRK